MSQPGVTAQAIQPGCPEKTLVETLWGTPSPTTCPLAEIRPEAPILDEARRELARVGLGQLMTVPNLRTPYEY